MIFEIGLTFVSQFWSHVTCYKNSKISSALSASAITRCYPKVNYFLIERGTRLRDLFIEDVITMHPANALSILPVVTYGQSQQTCHIDLDQPGNLARGCQPLWLTKSNKNKGPLAILVETSHSGTARKWKLPVHVDIQLKSSHSRTIICQQADGHERNLPRPSLL